MMTDLGVKKTIRTSRPRNAYYRMFGFGSYDRQEVEVAKTVFEAKTEICGLLVKHGGPEYEHGDVEVGLTHRNMKDIAEMIERYKDTTFRRFDRAMTVWLRQGVYGQNDRFRGCWDRITYPAWVSGEIRPH